MNKIRIVSGFGFIGAVVLAVWALEVDHSGDYIFPPGTVIGLLVGIVSGTIFFISLANHRK